MHAPEPHAVAAVAGALHAVARPARPRAGRPLVTLAVVLGLATLLAVAGCAANPDIAIPRPAAAPTVAGAPGPGNDPGREPSSAEAPSAGTASAPAVAASCTPGLWSVIKDHIDDPAVALVGMRDGCRQARIETMLDSSSGAVGVAICRKAAEVAYPSGVATITVTAADAREIAKGVAGSACARVP